MPNTRSSNRSTNFKAYYSKKAAPYQRYFPHRRKIVRRPEPHDDDGKKQMKFLPEMMRRRSTVQDSDLEDAESLEEEVDEDVTEVQSRRKGRKRNSDVMHDGETEEEDNEPVRPTPKRRRKACIDIPKSVTRRRRAAPAPKESDASDDAEEEEAPRPRLRRQSTMTQIVDGRLPPPGSLDPEFKRVKRTPRTSWGGIDSKKDVKKDLKQRTLTQMVHTMTPLVLDSDEELEEDQIDEEAYAAHHSFIFGNAEEAAVQAIAADNEDEENVPPAEESHPVPNEDDCSEDEYQPTQFIETPVTSTKRTPFRKTSRRQATPAAKKGSKPTSKSPKTRFGLLSTPEKRGVREIASSQSPPESPISTQNTPRKSGRTPLHPRSANTANTVEIPPKRGVETPSKRKQVTFQEGPQEHIPPPALKKFASTIPDSEDEDGGLSDTDNQSDAEYGVGQETQALVREGDRPLSGLNVGADTQAILLDIDRACADTAVTNRDGSEELGEPVVQQDDEGSEELGHQPTPHTASDSTGERSTDTPELPALPFSSPKPQNVLSGNVEPNDVTEANTSPPLIQQLPSSPPAEDFRTQPPTPMFADDESPEGTEEPAPTTVQLLSTPTKPPRSTPPIEDFRTQPPVSMFDDDEEPSEDLDDIPAALATGTTIDHSIQVPRSPPAHLHPEPSHSSQAERQLQFEYQTYSHFRRPGPEPSSMHVAHDSNYSYQHTPHPFSHHLTQHHPNANSHISQATTVDPTQFSPATTPRKTRPKPPMFTSPAARTPRSGQTQKRDRSATTTPKTQGRTRSSTTTPTSLRRDAVGMSSPEPGRPAPLFIPSSFPSPARVTMEGWSSPVVGRESQWEGGGGSLENFSIPAPPPGSSQWVDDEDEDEL
ncbi:hypothetical protein BU23DRAFT_550718 [Bimuria novae-zelandiae CBS 107.79]|uniref:Uncharacterized protein n=1 Tax=Bimuria novae-zelandiae CBS 107.79 TaxID=1447943 RepID=A0A6A5VL39_9PLEO|nr:hypothetical protein BU23DRAFT_550718 [Bimuria novae-zelandiae CBS 107.79]